MSLNGYPHDPAIFVIFLEFELRGGVRDVKAVAQYRVSAGCRRGHSLSQTVLGPIRRANDAAPLLRSPSH